MELETHLLIAQRLSFISATELDGILGLTDEVSRMLAGLSSSLRR